MAALVPFWVRVGRLVKPRLARKRCVALFLSACCLSTVGWISLHSSNIVLAAGEGGDPFASGDFSQWATGDGKNVPAVWEFADGVIHLKKGKDIGRGGNILTKVEYSDFELKFDFKIAKGGNSGIKYRVRSYNGRQLGFEYQIYDDAGARNVASKNSTGSIYDLYEPNDSKKLNPAGEWNEGKIVVRGPKIEHWLNGECIVQATIGDADWEKRYQESKFNDAKNFGKTLRGKLMITDHGSEVWLKNIEFKEIP